MLDELHISGDLAGLITAYLDRLEVEPPGQRTRLLRFDASRRMTYAQWWHELAVLRDHTGKPHVGLEVGSCIAPEHCGVLGYLCLSSSSVLEVTANLERYQGLLYGGPPATFESRGDIVHIRWLAPHQAPVRESDEALLSLLMHLIRLLTGNDRLIYGRIGFMHKAPPDEGLYEEFFGCPVRFDCPELHFEAPASVLALPVRHADPALKRLLTRQADDLLAEADESSEFLRRFKQALLKAMRHGQPDQRFVASELHVSTRTLRRRLQEHGLQFRTVLSSIRIQLAKDYLKANKLTLSEITLLLGYSEQSAFSRAFSEWTGSSPLTYRKESLRSPR